VRAVNATIAISTLKSTHALPLEVLPARARGT
jgi:hypothetical protein